MKLNKNLKRFLIYVMIIGMIISTGLLIKGFFFETDYDSYWYSILTSLSLFLIFGGILGLLTNRVALTFATAPPLTSESHPKAYWIFNLLFITLGIIMLIYFTWHFKLE